MSEKLQTLKYTFTVEGETEQWYLNWLRDQINHCEMRTFNVVIDAKVQQSPARFYKGTTRMATPEVIHICDVESNEPEHAEKFREILSQMKEAKINKRIIYRLGYSNFTFELWMILHKRDCNGSLNHRSQYLKPINLAFGENFEDLASYKQEKNFKRCLSKLTLKDVKDAIRGQRQSVKTIKWPVKNLYSLKATGIIRIIHRSRFRKRSEKYSKNAAFCSRKNQNKNDNERRMNQCVIFVHMKQPIQSAYNEKMPDFKSVIR